MYKLIIVDDEIEIRKGISLYFPWDELGFEVAGQFENGRQALDFCCNSSIDVVLTDIKMPIMNGLELAKELSARKLNLKVVFLSGYREFDYAREALMYGVKSYIVKPSKFDEIYAEFLKIKSELDNLAIPKKDSFQTDLTQDKFNYYEQIIIIVKTYIDQHYSSATLDTAAGLAHLSPFYLSNLFKKKTGENFSEYLTKVRMKKAAELLKDISLKFYQISDLVGFSNPKNFTRCFKKYYGKTPKEYRNS